MKEHPILFSAPMIRALLDGSKTQTRRVVKGFEIRESSNGTFDWYKNGKWEGAHKPSMKFTETSAADNCPYGNVGDRLWVREAWGYNPDSPNRLESVCYRADKEHELDGIKWKPSIHIPRWASRIQLEITALRVERLQDINRGDCMAEGCPFPNIAQETDPKKWYMDLWETINGAESWAANPWVWVIEFKRIG